MIFNNIKEYNDFLKANPKFTGVCIAFHGSGKKRFEYNFVNGKSHGKQFGWLSNGQKYYEYYFVDDFEIGIQFCNEKTHETKPNENTIWYILVRESL